MSLTNLWNKGKESSKDIPNNISPLLNKVTALKNDFKHNILGITFVAFATWCATNGWPKNNTPFIDSLSVPPQIQKWNENKSPFPYEGLEQNLTNSDSGINSNPEINFDNIFKNNYFSSTISGIGWKSGGDSYSWAWVEFIDDNFLLDLEYWPDYKKAAVVWKADLWDSGVYVKWWASVLERDVTGNNQTKWVTQNTFWFALGGWNNKTNLEFWGLVNKIGRVDFGSDADYDYSVNPWDVKTIYTEWIHRIITQLGSQFDLAGTLKQSEYNWEKYNWVDGRLTYYPNNDFALTGWYDSTFNRADNDFSVQAGFQYRWWGSKKSDNGWSPYVALTYNHKIWGYGIVEYRQWIANDPLSMKDTFEGEITTNQFAARQLDPEGFVTKTKKPEPEVDKNAPKFNYSWATSFNITQWATVTFPTITATDDKDASVTVTESWWDWNTSNTWTFVRTYTAEDSSWNKATLDLTYTVWVVQITTPNSFTFNDLTGQSRNTQVISDAITISGINTASPVSVSGWEYSINGGAFTSWVWTVNNGDSVRVRLTTSSSYSDPKSATLTVGWVSDSFDVTTEALPAQNVSFTTSDWLIDPANSSVNDGIIVADIWWTNVVVDCSVNSPYTCSPTQHTFPVQAPWTDRTETFNIEYNWAVVWSKDVTVTWQ